MGMREINWISLLLATGNSLSKHSRLHRRARPKPLRSPSLASRAAEQHLQLSEAEITKLKASFVCAQQLGGCEEGLHIL